MALVTVQKLQQFAPYRRSALTQAVRLSEKTASKTSVFLSHSHHDEALVELVIALFKKLGVAVYVDWLDQGLPDVTGTFTAAELRKKIGDNRKFVVLGTPNGLASRWVPWELGIADQKRGIGNIAVFPIGDRTDGWKGNEYMGLYPSIEEYAQGFVVVAGQSVTSLASWIQ